MNRITNLYKNAFSGLSPEMWWLSLVMLINRSGTMVIPFLTLYLTQSKHYTIGKAGMVMGVFGAGSILGGLLGGKLADKLGFHTTQVLSLFCGGTVFMVLGQMDSFGSILICTFFLAILNDCFRPANSTAVAHYSTTENRTRSFSLNRLAINLGWATGGALGGIIATWDYNLLFWIDGCTNMGAAILLLLVLSPSKKEQAAKKEEPTAAPVKATSAYADKPFMVFTVLTILFGCCFFQIFSTQPVYFKQVLLYNSSFIGILMAMNGIVVALMEMTLIFVLERKNRNMMFITIGTILVGLSFLIFNLFPGGMLLGVVATLIITVGEMLAMPFMNSFWVSRTNAGNRGQYAGLYSVSWAISQIAGPYTGGQIAQHYGFRALWWCVGLVSVITAVGFNWLRTYKK